MVRTKESDAFIAVHHSPQVHTQSRPDFDPGSVYCLDQLGLVGSPAVTRYPASKPPITTPGWSLDRLTPPSRVFGANGLRTGPDGRVYIAQVTGSQISALDLSSGAVEAISPKGGGIIAPDDVAFTATGALVATEVMNGRVSVLENGAARVLRDDVPSANGITVRGGRLFIGECRHGGRLLELPLDGGAPRVILENVPSPNAMEFGPDGKLYFPVMDANEIWRIDVDADGAEPERVAGDLGVPDSVKFDADGYIVSTQVFSGQVLRIDPRTGDQTVLAQLAPGLDNCTFANGKLYVSNFTGEITEISPDGTTRAALPGGLNWPLDLAVGADGALYVADGTYFYRLTPTGEKQIAGMLFTPGYPGFLRGLVPNGPGEFLVTTANGAVARYRPDTSETEVLADGFDQLYGVAQAPDGSAVVVEQGTGRVLAVRSGGTSVLAEGLQTPVGVVIAADGAVLVGEAGRVVTLSGGRVETLVDGLVQPQGLLIREGLLYIVDSGLKEVLAVDLNTGARQTIASDLPVGAPPGVTPKPLLGMPPFSGPQGPFAGIAAGPDGTLYVSADGDGSVLALRPTATSS
jgi:sugar lactone lactonase YvrE